MKYLQFKMEGVDDQGIFTGHASVFNVVDLDGDVVEPGAFAETLATGAASAGVLIFGQHEDRKEPLGRTLELREDSIGLYVKGQISDTTAGRDYRQLIRDGVLDQMSIGYIALEYYQSWRKAPAFRHGDISHTLLPRKEILRGLH